MNCSLDSSAMVAFLRNEPGAAVVEALLLDPNTTCFAHAVNLCEVFYHFYRRGGETDAQTVLATLRSAGIVTRDDLDLHFWQEVARLKAPRPNLPLGDCFCIALAQRLNGEIVTSDHPDFDPIAQAGVCPVRFIR
jgi:PIN domain nuclease of toxin-antitoxin system